MGLFSKESCSLCGNETSALNRTKLNNGMFLCSSCVSKTGLCEGFTSNVLKSLSIDKIKERIEYHSRDLAANGERIRMFNPTYQVGGFIWFDDNHKWFLLPKGGLSFSKENSYAFWYKDIIDFEVLEDGTTVTKGGLGKAIIGGAIFGLPGAIAGGTSKKTKEICNRLDIKITTRNPDRPIVYINVINSQFKKSGMIYKMASKSVQQILSKFQIILDEMEADKNNVVSNSNISVADEIKKFKELLDCGAITQEEFDKKKQQLLG